MASLESAGVPPLSVPDEVGVVCALVAVSTLVVELDVAVAAVEEEFIPRVIVEFRYPPDVLRPVGFAPSVTVCPSTTATRAVESDDESFLKRAALDMDGGFGVLEPLSS